MLKADGLNKNNIQTMKALSVVALLLVLFTNLNAQPRTADAILKEAFSKAEAEHKNVIVIFHASWCGWCHKMDKALSDTACKKFFDDSYIITHLVVKERKENKHLENPGAEALLTKHHGNQSGIPFWLVYNSKGELLADSQVRPAGVGLDAAGKNVGCPASEPEVAHFIEVLHKTSALNEEQLAVIYKRFRLNEQ